MSGSELIAIDMITLPDIGGVLSVQCAMVAEARAAFMRKHPQLYDQEACLYWTLATCATLQQYGYRAILQAGTMYWRCIRPEDDDGVVNTHFGYEFEPGSPASQKQLSEGLLPEIHIWCALPDEGEQGEIVDLSTYGFRRAAEKRGLRWTEPDPPEFFWGVPDDRMRYRASLTAIKFAHWFIANKVL